MTIPELQDGRLRTGRRPPRDPELEGEGPRIGHTVRRWRDTALRIKWVLVAVVAAGVVAGVGATRIVEPEYLVRSTVYLGARRDAQAQGGPIREGEFVQREGWVDVLRSNRVLEPVVERLRLWRWTKDSTGSAVFGTMVPQTGARGGTFTLRIIGGGTRYEVLRGLQREKLGKGTLPDSVGRWIGLDWQVPAGALSDGDYGFGFLPPREAAGLLNERLITTLSPGDQILTLSLRDEDAFRGASVVNQVVDEFLVVAQDLQRTQASEYQTALREQLTLAEQRLRDAEQALQTFRSSTITQPGEANAGATDPLVRDYFDKRLSLENLRRDRESLEQLLASSSGLSVERLLAIPSVSSQTTGPLRDALQELGAKEVQLRAARQQYSDEYATVRDLAAQVNSLRRETIPRLARLKLDEMRLTERDLDRTVGSFSGELRRIPQRTIQEIRLKRDFAVADQFYTSLLSRWNEVRLAAAGESSDLKVIDRAYPPSIPTKNSRLFLLAAGALGGLGLAVVLVFLVDRLDPRLRYAEETEDDLRLDVLARIPVLPRETKRNADMLTAAQAVEAFRTLRLRLQHEFRETGQVTVVISSAGANEGKSLVTANLASSFADAGCRTVLVDGDLRRGKQHEPFGVPAVPGLTDLLGSRAGLEAVLRPTGDKNLWVVPAGSRSQRVPELLDRDRIAALVKQLAAQFEVVLIDSAPLGAGVDTYAIATAASAMVLVVRHGVTNRTVADGKLDAMDRLPVRQLGAVLNAVPINSAFSQYDSYSYLNEYALVGGDAPTAVLPKPK